MMVKDEFGSWVFCAKDESLDQTLQARKARIPMEDMEKRRLICWKYTRMRNRIKDRWVDLFA